MKYFGVILLLIALPGCYRDIVIAEDPCVTIDTQFIFSIRNSAGEDLLAPDVANHFQHEQIMVYDFSNGKKTPSDKRVSRDQGFYTLQIYTKSAPYNVDTKGESVTLLQFSEAAVDTVRAEWKAGHCHFFNTKMWYNSELKWEHQKTAFPIVIIK